MCVNFLRLFLRPHFQPHEIHFSENRPRFLYFNQRAPKRSLADDSEKKKFERLKKTQLGIGACGEPDFDAAKFLREPSACITQAAVFIAKPLNKAAKLIVIGLDFFAQPAKERLERIILMLFDQMIDQFQSRHPTGVMILKIYRKVLAALIFLHSSNSH